MQHESSMEEDTKIDRDVLPASHSNGEVDKEASKNDENVGYLKAIQVRKI